ncbi:MAG: hypothetical protein RBT15_09930, partial [Gudongella sp.]|nr:hypothetical protein [Gudongella sp.]
MNEMRIPKSKKIKKWLSILIIAALVIPLCISFPAGATSLKEEVVYVKLNNDGSVDKVYVVNRFQLDEDGDILDYGNYEYVKNLSGSETLRLESGRVTMGTKVDKLQYEGFLMDPQIPWEISIKYILDGNEISPDDLAGKTGHLDIVIETKRNPKGSEEFFDSYALQIAMTLKGDLTKNITAEDGTLATAGNDKQINFIVLPGKEASLQLSADVTKFEMPSVTIAGVRLNMDFDFDDVDMSEIRELIDGIAELDDGVIELLDGVFELKDGTHELYDGVVELQEGTEELKDGVKDLSEGTEELKDGVRDLKDGTGEMADGAIELADGSDELVDGMRDFNKGVREFSDGIDQLYDGIGELADGTRRLNSGIAELDQGAAELVYGAEELFEYFDDYFEIILSLVNEQVVPMLGQELTRYDYQQKLYPLIGYSQDAHNLLKLLAGYEALLDNFGGEPTVNTTGGGISLVNGLKGLSGGIHQYRDGVGEYYSGIKKFYRESEELVDGAHELKSGTRELLKGMIEYRDGIAEFKDGVIELHDGVIELFDGIVELHDGVIELYDGTIELNDGVIELVDGVRELADGTDELYDGVAELRDGTKELREETATLDTDIIDGIKEKFDELMGKGMP